ncbi:MAG: N-acetylmuramoyl-L-alanine amidase [Bacteroidota bacterium]
MGTLCLSGHSLHAQNTAIASENSSVVIDFTKPQPPQPQQQTNLIWTAQGITQLRRNQQGVYVSQTRLVPLTNVEPHLSFTLVAEIENYDPQLLDIQIRFFSTENGWSEWSALSRDHDIPFDPSIFNSEMVILGTQTTSFEFVLQYAKGVPGLDPVLVKSLRFDFFSPGSVPVYTADDNLSIVYPGASTDCGCGIPAYVSRTSWYCPDKQSPSCNNAIFAPVSHIIVHQTGGPNYSTNWSAIVHSIWNKHVNSNGWCDIGYNWLIDPNGMIYEGAGGGNNVIGNHYCGSSEATMGIGMLGDFRNSSPTAAALLSLERLMAWKACDASIDPLADAYHAPSARITNNIASHSGGCDIQYPNNQLDPAIQFAKIRTQATLDSCNRNLVASIEQWSLSGFHSFPNPVRDQLTVMLESASFQDGQLTLVNPLGQTLYQERVDIVPGQNHWQLSPESISSGVYHLFISTPQQKLHRSLIWER